MNVLADNLSFYMEENNLSQRELAKSMQLGHSTLSRIINETNQDIQPSTKRKIVDFFGFNFDDISSIKLSELLTQKKNNKVKFMDFNGEFTKENINTTEEYSFAINVKEDTYEPLFPVGSILFFATEPAYQKDICIIKHKNKILLCSIINSYRLELDVLDLDSNKKISILRQSIKGVLMKILNPS